MQASIYKDDSAETEFSYGMASSLYNTVGWFEKFVNGRINDYATTKTGLANQRNYLVMCMQ